MIKVDKKLRQATIIFFITSVMVMFSVGLFNTIKYYKELKSYEFNGIVDSALYTIKGSVTVKIRDETFFLKAGPYNFSQKIEEGDSLIKKSGSYRLVAIDRKTGEKRVYGDD